MAVARRSLKHFAVGRVVSAVVGITTLLVLVRVLDRVEYGLYIALMAGFEIAQLAASPGAYAVVFRYWPEMRQAGAAGQLQRLTKLLAFYRLLSLAFVGGLLALFAPPIAGSLGMPSHASALRIFAITFVFESASRLLDAQFESLLQQGVAQSSVLFRNSLKLIALLVMSRGGQDILPLTSWITIESIASFAGWFVSTLLMWRSVKALSAESSGIAVDMRFARIKSFSLPTYLSQVLYLCSGAEMVKLILGKLVGAGMVAPFGFAAALSATVQRYLPSFLLVGWLRPLFISARQAGKSSAEISSLASAVVKLNLLVLAPVATGIAVAGPGIVGQLSGGRLPDAEGYLYFFSLLLVAQSIRAVIALLGVVFELGPQGLHATLLSLFGLAAGAVLYPLLGAWAFCIGLVISEIVWALSMLRALRNSGTDFQLPWLGLAKLFASALGAAGTVFLVVNISPTAAAHPKAWLALAIVGALACLALSAILKPFTSEERMFINRLLPGRFFVW